MAGMTPSPMVDEGGAARQLHPQWNLWMIAASIAISLLGAFTSTQLMCQARTSRTFSGVLVWTMLSSLTFGFCSIWSLHEVATLACQLDLPISVNVPLTVLSSILAVLFTFGALASDMLWDKYNRGRERNSATRKWGGKKKKKSRPRSILGDRESVEPLLRPFEREDEEENRVNLELEPPSHFDLARTVRADEENAAQGREDAFPSTQHMLNVDPAQPSLAVNGHSIIGMPKRVSLQSVESHVDLTLVDDAASEATTDTLTRASSAGSVSQRSSSFLDSNQSTFGLGNFMSIHPYRSSTASSKSAFIRTGRALYTGCTRRNMIKGSLWSLAITCMHYVGISALSIPEGYFLLNPLFVLLSAVICWVVCLVGCILMAQMETHLTQQLLFSVVATAGVAAMHFTGMRAATFWSHALPSENGGYPPGLAVAVTSIAITTCIAANALLAHSATVSRNKLAEIVLTRRKLWMAIAQKENAESAAAARSDFIASASHEIRTPLHHLQGYSDLLSRTELTEEGRLLLYAIQHATKTLSLITNNVLDWSRLESDGEAICRPVALDMRTVCESIITLLPNKDDDVEAELMVVVAPDVPQSLFLDETYIHRILMNLLSNALKFTSSGYIVLLIELKGGAFIVTVKDTGMGIPASFLPQLFDPFTQAQTRTGSQRGTGLGLSIIKQLLHKMQGTIEVESRHQETDGIEPGQTGTTFTITIPVQVPAKPQNGQASNKILPKIAIFHGGDEQSREGLCMAWEKFEYDVLIAEQYSDVEDFDPKYIWADLSFLSQNTFVLDRLLQQDRRLVLVPCDTQTSLQDVPGLISAPHFIPIQKPLIWHSFEQRIALSTQPSHKPSLEKSVRFASKVNVVDSAEEEKLHEESSEKKHVVLLVEDNPINRKLGIKMLTSLSYAVLTAEDGVQALEQLLLHDATIDAILMDQSMPRKDGLTATREIRELEASGRLSRRRPIIAVTAVVSQQAQALCKLAGTDDFLAKPLSMGRLEETLRLHLGRADDGPAAGGGVSISSI